MREACKIVAQYKHQNHQLGYSLRLFPKLFTFNNHRASMHIGNLILYCDKCVKMTMEWALSIHTIQFTLPCKVVNTKQFKI